MSTFTLPAATLSGSPVAPASQPRPWLQHYPPGVPADITLDPSVSLVDVIDEAMRRHAQRDAEIFLGQSLKFGDIDEMSRSLAAWLQHSGLARGARVALMLPNTPQYMVAIAAVLRAGMVVVNVNPLYTPRELEHQLKDSGAQAIVILENFAHTLEQVLERTGVQQVVLAAMGDLLPGWRGPVINFALRHVKKMVPGYRLPDGGSCTVTRFNAALEAGRARAFQPVRVQGEDIAFLQYTGGTTGVSKGAVLLHRNVVANILQTEAWFQPMLARLGEQPMTIVCALPLYHIFALTVCYFMGLRLGSRNLLIPNPRDVHGFISALARQPFHMFPAVNTLYNLLLNEPAFAQLDFSHLLVSNGGGMAVQQATAERWLKVTGCPICEGYGLSETSPIATANRVDLRGFSGTIGLPIPGTDIAIRDDEGRDLPPGEPGEICIRGPQVMAGYWQRPAETAQVLDAAGWFRSGDVGVMDGRGHVRIVDRKKDMILVSGFNVYPNEIEQVISQHPGVLECAAVGVRDEHSGEAVKLYVVRRDATLTEADLVAYCRENFTAYKRPRHIEFRDELPKTNVGKILRRALRDSPAKS